MIVWLTKNLDVGARVLVSMFVFFWMMFISLLAIVHYDALVKRVDTQFNQLQEDHREIRALMTRNTKKFGGIMESNTEAVNRASDTVRKAHEQEGPPQKERSRP